MRCFSDGSVKYISRICETFHLACHVALFQGISPNRGWFRLWSLVFTKNYTFVLICSLGYISEDDSTWRIDLHSLLSLLKLPNSLLNAYGVQSFNCVHRL